MTRTFAAYLAAALASMSGLSAGATAKPILETSEQAFSPVLTCNGKVGAGGAFPKITAALDASQEITVSMWVCVDKFPSADDTGPTKMLGLFSRGWGLRCTLDRTLGVQLTYPGENGGKDRYAYCQWAVPPNGLRKGDWNHFAFTCSATNAALYVNGEIKASSRTIAGSRIACRGETFRLGTLPGYAPMNGKIGRARVWDRALRLDEIIASERDAARELAANFGEKTDDMAEAAKSRIRYRLDAADRALAAGKPLYWGIVDPMGPATFSHDSDIEPDAINKPLLVCAAKGEYEAASFVVRPMEDIKGFVPTVSGFKTKSGATLPPSIVDVRFVKEAVVAGGNRFIRVRRGEYLLHDDALLKCDFEKMQSFIRLDTPTGTVYRCVTEPMDSNRFEKYMSAEEWPIHDADTMQPLALTKREGVQYWLTFHVPADAKAGLYTGSVHLTAKGRRVASIPVKLRVLPFELPEPRTGYDVTKKFRPGVYYRHNWHNLSDPKACGSITSCGRNERQFRAELRSLKAHNILYPTVVMAFAFPGWVWDDYWGKDPTSGGGHERVVSPGQRKYFMRCMSILKEEGFPTDQMFLHTGGNFGFRTGYDPVRSAEVLKRVLQDTLSMVREAVHPGVDVRFYGVDEAWGEALEREYLIWADIHKFGGRVFTTAVRRHTPDIAGRADTLIASGEPARKFAKMMHDKGGEIWNYANPQADEKHRAFRYRVNFGFGCYSEEYDGFATYAWNVSAENPWNDFDNRIEPDLAFVVGTADGVVDTPSHEGYREAVDDIRYATKLRMLCRERPGRLADEATAFLDGINVYERGFDAGYTRLRIIDFILKLMRD